MYDRMQGRVQGQEVDTWWKKVSRNSYLIVSISLLTHITSIVYSLMTFKEESAGFVAIIVSSTACFFVSSSHLTIYGISILGTLYTAMLVPYYPRHQLYYITTLSGVIMFCFWRTIHSVGAIFRCFPGRVHASMVFGITLLVLTKFFPLAIENVPVFFQEANSSALKSPFLLLQKIFADFRVLTLCLTGAALVLLAVLRSKLEKIPLIGILALMGIFANYQHIFKSYQDLCLVEGVDCKFYIVNVSQIQTPLLSQLIEVLPAALLMTIVLIFEQFLYLEQFSRTDQQRTGLGEIRTESKTLAIANIISGCLGGLPICINLFATYENFAFNHKFARKATKWVGILQVPFSYCLYSFLSQIFNTIPLFVLFTLVATPMAYYLEHIFILNRQHIPLICLLAVLNVITHPLLALIFASFVSIYDIAELLRNSPAEMIISGFPEKEKNEMLARVSERKSTVGLQSEFISRVLAIEQDTPEEYEDGESVLYRFVGIVSFLNCHSHVEGICNLVQKYNLTVKPYPMLLSFRYSQATDEQSLEQIAQMSEDLRRKGVRMLFTGLHKQILNTMQHVDYFAGLLKQDDRCIYKITE